MLDLRKISTVAPIGDLKFGLYAVLAAVVVANLLVISSVWRSDVRSSILVLIVFAIGAAAAVATLIVSPSWIYLAILVYVIAFLVNGSLVAMRTESLWILLIVAFGFSLMLVALMIAYWIAHAPR